MRRSDLEHPIRASGAISGSSRLLVIGSQSILGQYPYDAPDRATLSMQADLLPLDAPEMSELLTGSIGEMSHFHHTFGHFADGVSMDTATLPSGWQDCLIRIDNPNTNRYVSLCLETHDLLLSKYFAGRDKDREFCTAVVHASLVDQAELGSRLSTMTIDASHHDRMARWISEDFSGRPT